MRTKAKASTPATGGARSRHRRAGHRGRQVARARRQATLEGIEIEFCRSSCHSDPVEEIDFAFFPPPSPITATAGSEARAEGPRARPGGVNVKTSPKVLWETGQEGARAGISAASQLTEGKKLNGSRRRPSGKKFSSREWWKLGRWRRSVADSRRAVLGHRGSLLPWHFDTSESWASRRISRLASVLVVRRHHALGRWAPR